MNSNKFIVCLGIARFVFGQQTDLKNILPSLCQGSNTPICSFCNSNTAYCDEDFLSIASKACEEDFKGDARCGPINDYCKANTCAVSPLPSAVQATTYIYLICDEMPNMVDCATCPPPKNGISDCPLLDTYSKLCIDMPGMTQCDVHSQICDKFSDSSFCSTTGSKTTSTGSGSSIANQFCDKNKSICISGMPGGEDGESCFRIQTDHNGWAGFGIGKGSMMGSDMYIAFKDETGALSIGNYIGSGPEMPKAVVPGVISSSKVIEGENLAFEFCRKNSNDVKVTKVQRYIYAFSRSRPKFSDSRAEFPFHDGGYDSFTQDYTTGTSFLSSNYAKRSCHEWLKLLLGFSLLRYIMF